MTVLKYKTEKTFTNITGDIKRIIPEDFNGVVNIFSAHTTLGVKILEDEELLKADYYNFLNDIFPENGGYQHDIISIRSVPPDERINGHSHLRMLFFPTSETIPIENGKMLLGKWQSIFIVETDPIREREIIVTLCRI